MPLYERLMGLEDGKPPIHSFQATLGEFARNRINGTQAQAIIAHSAEGIPLTAGEVTEAQALLATVTGSASARLARVAEIDHVLMLAERLAPGYDTAAAIRSRLGV
jgi:hypothetical protein